MALVPVGGRIVLRDDAQNVGTVGCYICKHGDRRTVFAVTAGHVFKTALRQAGAVVVGGVPGDGSADTAFGALTDQCTDLRPDVLHSVDAALVAVDPGLVATTLAGTADRLDGFRLAGDLEVGMPVTVLGARSGPQPTTILDWDATGAIAYDDPAIGGNRSFDTLVLCAGHVTQQGDSGAPVFDAQRKLIGFVLGSVAAPTGTTTPDGLVTALLPAELVLTRFGQCDLLSAIPAEAVAPDLSGPPAGGALDLAWLATAEQKDMAQRIIAAFAAAGYGRLQQAVAVANAFAESSLNPRRRNQTPPEDSCGLFQFNRNGGEGAGLSVEQLFDPDFNIAKTIAIFKARIPGYMTASTVADAVGVFVRDFERPADQPAAIARRIEITNRML